MIVKQLKLSQQEKERLIRLKAKTGISQWNVLCRCALCWSLDNPAIPMGPEIPSDSNVEMSWHTFGGECHEIYDAIVRQRCKEDGYDKDQATIARHFRLHLNRGINFLASKNGPKNSQELLALVLPQKWS
ncbi:DNA sulfur modification protein DndE [Desulfosporosinus shakirovi]|uniref:DNA sulfur modification protein DndE n=1 Tax=Desulfosporosinus shakirovi TaxID=2885154 RepID=UPI001E3D66FE|nr:DNA sulfur modification protein DndE [Desulfosporosinus sp. SRJS8]MCB8814721.1 DNA sulfur modification protein DndE [Desulfosporosinus sp. SRJS8]